MKEKGFSLIELLVVIAIIGIITGMATPMFQQSIVSNRLFAEKNNIVNILSYARGESLRRNDYISICPSVDLATCSGTDYSKGSLIFLNPNKAGLAGASQIIKIYDKLDSKDKAKLSTGSMLTFNGRGNAINSADILVCKPSYPSYTVSLSLIGKISLSFSNTDGGC